MICSKQVLCLSVLCVLAVIWYWLIISDWEIIACILLLIASRNSPGQDSQRSLAKLTVFAHQQPSNYQHLFQYSWLKKFNRVSPKCYWKEDILKTVANSDYSFPFEMDQFVTTKKTEHGFVNEQEFSDTLCECELGIFSRFRKPLLNVHPARRFIGVLFILHGIFFHHISYYWEVITLRDESGVSS